MRPEGCGVGLGGGDVVVEIRHALLLCLHVGNVQGCGNGAVTADVALAVRPVGRVAASYGLGHVVKRSDDFVFFVDYVELLAAVVLTVEHFATLSVPRHTMQRPCV